MPELAEKIRAKYPGKYDSINDDELEQKIVTKYPQYQHLVPEKGKEPPAALKVDSTPERDTLISEAKKTAFKPSVSGDIPSKASSTTPKKIAEEPKNEEGIISKFSNAATGFLERHPGISDFITGHSAAADEYAKARGVNPDVKGPGFMEIPGVRRFTDKLAQDITGSEGDLRLSAGALVKGVGDILATGFDPRSVAIGKAIHDPNIIDAKFKSEPVPDVVPQGENLPVRRGGFAPRSAPADINLPLDIPQLRGGRGTEVPYRMEGEIPSVRQEVSPEITPPTDVARDFAPVGEEGNLINNERALVKSPEESLFEQAKRKFNMGLERPAEEPGAKYNSSFTNEQGLEEFGPPPEVIQPSEELPVRPTARHIGTQEGYGDIPSQEMYNIQGGPDNESTVFEQGLKDRGIEVPARNESLRGKSGDQIRAEAIAERNKSVFKEPIPEPQMQRFTENKSRGIESLRPFKEPTEPQFSRAFDPKGNEPGTPIVRTNQNPDWVEAKHDADILGIDTDKFEHLEDLKWAITQKTAQETIRTGKNPLSERGFRANEPEAAVTKGGKLAIGADVKSLGKVLGTSLYKGDIAPIATKELLQNSIDAVRHLGTGGQINVMFDKGNNIIHVEDNGKGLTKKELETVFTDLGASGKREDVEAAGGFGLAKAAPLLGGKKVQVVSTAKDRGKIIQSSFEGTPNELLEGVNIKQKEMPAGTKTGTTVRVHVPENSDMYSAERFVDNLSQYSHGMQADIRTGVSHSKGENYANMNMSDPNFFKSIPKGSGESLAKLDNPSASTEIIIPKNSRRAARSFIEVKLSNNGMYQATKTKYFTDEVPNLPREIIVDIRSKVPEGHGDYPFTANREELRGSVEQQVDQYIKENLVKPAIGKRMDELKRLYEGMPEISIGGGEFPNNFKGRKIALYDPKGQMDPAELRFITNKPTFRNLAKTIAEILDEAMLVMDNPTWMERLEKIGIIFDDKLHGIHIPNPATGKSAILVNPLLAIRDSSPDAAAASILHTILHELAHVEPAEQGHNESFTIRLGDIYGKFGARRSVAAQDRIVKAITEPENLDFYTDEIQEILQRYTQSRGNAATTEDLLTGTGIKQGVKGPGEGDIPEGDRQTRKGVNPRTRGAVDKLLQAMSESKDLQEVQQAAIKQERGRRFAAFEGVSAEGKAGAAKSMGKLSGEYDREEISALEDSMSEEEVNTLFSAVKYANITTPEKARGYSALFKLLDGGKIPDRSELKLLDEVFGGGFSDNIILMHGGLGGFGLRISKVANTMKAMRSSFDLSAPLRQGIGLIHKPEYRHAFAEMFKYVAKPEYFRAAMEAIESDPLYLVAREAGLFLARPGDLMNAEEAFMNSYIPNIPKFTGIPAGIDASERGYVGFLNTLRFDVFRNLIKQAKALGNEVYTVKSDDSGGTSIVTSKATDDIAKFINTATGRGHLGRLEKVAGDLNTVFWSPRLMKSRLDVFNPKYYMKLDKFARNEAIKSLFAIAATGLTVAGFGKIWELMYPDKVKVSANPLSSDFMKVRFADGNVLDPWAGHQQIVVATARFIAGRTNTKPQSQTATVENFFANKLSPMAALAYEIGSAQKWTGKEAPGNVKSFGLPQKGGFVSRYGQPKFLTAEIVNSFAPMFQQDMVDVFQNNAPFAEQVGLDMASFLGMGVQSYPESNPQKGFKKMNLQQRKLSVR